MLRTKNSKQEALRAKKLTILVASGKNPESMETFVYDANGNLIADGKNKYKWDAENRLIRIDYSKSGKFTTFAYNALGQCQKIVEVEDGRLASSKLLVWCDAQICEERDEAGALIRQIFPLGERSGDKNLFYLRDHLGSTRQLCDASGSVLGKLNYDPFGQLVDLDASGILPALQYAGYYAHQPSLLNLTRFRFYNGRLGRWLSRDPVGEFGLSGQPEWPVRLSVSELLSSNLYAYCLNDPVNYTDPLGLQPNQHSRYASLTDNRIGRNEGGAGYGGTTNAPATAGFGAGTFWLLEPEPMYILKRVIIGKQFLIFPDLSTPSSTQLICVTSDLSSIGGKENTERLCQTC